MEEKYYGVPTQPQGIFQTIKTGFSIWKYTFSQTVVLSVINAIMSWLLLYYIVYIKQERVLPWYFKVLGAIISLTISISMVYRIDKYIHNEYVSFNRAVVIGCRKVLPMLLGIALYFFVEKIGMHIISSMILIVFLTFLPWLVIIDENSIVNAIRKSFTLVIGNCWHTVGAVIVITLMCCLVCFLLAFIDVGILFLSYQYGIHIDYFAWIIVSSLLITLIISIMYPLICACNIAILYNLKARNKEKFSANSLALN
ncbi:MAG: hypothetical protein ABSA84_01540 [Gammaproteobacteria bacterium]|jgi:hypothetical protein